MPRREPIPLLNPVGLLEEVRGERASILDELDDIKKAIKELDNIMQNKPSTDETRAHLRLRLDMQKALLMVANYKISAIGPISELKIVLEEISKELDALHKLQNANAITIDGKVKRGRGRPKLTAAEKKRRAELREERKREAELNGKS